MTDLKELAVIAIATAALFVASGIAIEPIIEFATENTHHKWTWWEGM